MKSHCRRHILGLYLAAAILMIDAGTSWAADQGKVNYHKFEVTQKVAEHVWFWEAVFSSYNADNMIIHDTRYPNIIVDVVDYRQFSAQYNGGRVLSREQKSDWVDRYVKRYELALSRFHERGKDAAQFGPMEKRILAVYSRHRPALADLLAGKATLRTQQGMADQFKTAAKRAEVYLPYMERIFRQQSMPVDLTRLAFVESMFNTKARSKVGAVGIWQFMPETARSFMLVNRYIDERQSPIKATYAAASFLKQNFKELGTWPLAVTAYNHGPAGMKRAARTLGTKDLSTIIYRYKSPTFGFASQNFYAEFVAARNVYNRSFAKKFNRDHNPLNITAIKLNKPTSVSELINKTPLDEKTLREFNPCIQKEYFASQRHKPLPRNYELVVPIAIENEVRSSLNNRGVIASQKSGRTRI